LPFTLDAATSESRHLHHDVDALFHRAIQV